MNIVLLYFLIWLGICISIFCMLFLEKFNFVRLTVLNSSSKVNDRMKNNDLYAII